MSDRSQARSFRWRRWIVFGVAIALVYFGNVEVQSYLGRKALANTGLDPVSLDRALEQAGVGDKRVLADLSAIWCPGCRKFDRKVLADPDVRQAILRDYVFARIEYESDEGEAFMERYGVEGFPTLVVLEADGTFVRELTVTFDPQQFLRQLGG